MSAELDGLLAALPDDTGSFTRRCAEVRDWPALLRDGEREGVAAVLHAAIRDAGLTLPFEARQAAERQGALDALWRAQLDRTLDEALAALDAHAIRVVPLKGPALAERLYPDPSVRPSSDLDLLVAPGDLDRAAAALATLGYQPEAGPADRYHRAHHHHIHLLRAQPPMIELHFRAYAGFGIVVPADALLARAAERRTARGRRIWVPAPEDEWLYLAVHAAGHAFERLIWLHDLKLLLRRHPDLDWTAVADRARALGVATAVAATCDALRRLDTPVPVARGLGVSRGPRRLLLVPLGAVARRAGAGPTRTLAQLLWMSSLCDRPACAVRFLAHHGGRIARRRVHRSFPGLAPAEWSA